MNQHEEEADETQAQLNEARWLLKSCRAILNTCGYPDTVEAIDEFLKGELK